MATEHLVITGRSGAGISTTAANLSAALAEQGHRVAHVGYDRQGMSDGVLRGRTPLLPADADDCPDDRRVLCAIGFHGILCLDPGLHRGTAIAPRTPLFRRARILTDFRPDFVVHDLAGAPETVLPLLMDEEGPMRLFVVTSADFSALATLNLFIDAFASQDRYDLRFGGLVANNIAGPVFESLVDDFTREAGSKPIVTLPRSLAVSTGEYLRQTVIESAPHSSLSNLYHKLASLVVQGLGGALPHPVGGAAFAAWQKRWSGIIEELDSGMVRNGAAI